MISKETIKNKERFNLDLTKEDLKKALDYSISTIDYLLEKTGDTNFTTANSKDGIYGVIDNLTFPQSKNPDNWTTGFWSGQIWLAYKYTKNERYKEIGQKHTKTFEDRLNYYYNVDRKLADLDHHDIGFLFLLSTKADYQLTGDQHALDLTLKASKLLMNRYLPTAKILQAWGDLNNPLQQGRMIIDCNLNIPLLYFSERHLKDEKYKEVAINHLRNANKVLIREDASTYHTFFFDIETGEPKFGNTHQGFSDTSSWARGQAWGIMGFALAYGITKEKEFLESAIKLSNYFLNRLPEDLVCNWDLIFTKDSDQRDTSAAAIAAIGFLEISKYVEDDIYLKAAKSITKSLINNYLGNDKEGILKSGVYHYHGNLGINEYLTYGDYYFMELLMRLYKENEFISFWDIES